MSSLDNQVVSSEVQLRGFLTELEPPVDFDILVNGRFN